MSSPPSPSCSIYPSNQKVVEQEIKPPTISKIEISQADLDKLNRTLQSNKAGSFTKVVMQRKIVGICVAPVDGDLLNTICSYSTDDK